MPMKTHIQIANRSTCGPSCLMMAGRDANHYTIPFTTAQEKMIHNSCATGNKTLDDYCLPGKLADYAVSSIGFSKAEVILSGNLFVPKLLQQYGNTPGCYPSNSSIPVKTWKTGLWSPRCLGTGAKHYYLIAVICVDSVYSKKLSHFLVPGWLRDLAVGMGITGNNPNMSLHWILYHDHSYTDPANGLQYWSLSRMGGSTRTYWDTGVYVHMYD